MGDGRTDGNMLSVAVVFIQEGNHASGSLVAAGADGVPRRPVNRSHGTTDAAIHDDISFLCFSFIEKTTPLPCSRAYVRIYIFGKEERCGGAIIFKSG